MNLITPVQPTVRIASHNPYDARYPGLKVVSRETLHLIKELRANGIAVVIEPDDERPLIYTSEKGFREFIADPVCAFLTAIPVSLMVNLLSTWISDRLKHRPTHSSANEKPGDGTSLVMEVSEDGRKLRYDEHGRQISDERFRALLGAMELRARGYGEATFAKPADPRLPYPIFLEHTPRVVGWANVLLDRKGLRCDPAKIEDEEAWLRIRSGELRGMSIAILVYDSRCSICDRQYVSCDHVSGREYAGTQCTVEICGVYLADISIVRAPVNPECLISLTPGYEEGPS